VQNGSTVLIMSTMFYNLQESFQQITRFFQRARHINTAHTNASIKAVTESPILGTLSSSIINILRVSGATGASIGILDGNQVHLAGFSSRNLSASLAPDVYTVYHLASLSKSFTATAITLLVLDGKLSFQDRIYDILPGFHHANNTINTKSTILDFISYRTGLASKKRSLAIERPPNCYLAPKTLCL